MPDTTQNPRLLLRAAATLAALLCACAPALAATRPCAAPAQGNVAQRDDCSEWPRAAPRHGMRMSNRPNDGRTGGTPQTSARVPGGPPDDVNTGLTFAIPSVNAF